MALIMFKYLLMQILINLALLSTAYGLPTVIESNTGVTGASTDTNEVAGLLENLMNPNLNPCDNFYRFVCGGLIDSASTSSKVTSPHDEIINEMNMLIMKNLDENSDEETEEISLIRNAKNLYQACKNAHTMREINVNTFLDLLDESIGGWPVLKMDTWNSSLFDWKRTIYRDNNNNEITWDNSFFPFEASETKNDTIYFPVSSLRLDKNLLMEENKKQLHDDNYSEMERMLHDLGGNKSNNVTEELNKIIDFEIKLAKILFKHENSSIEELYNFIERTDKKIVANYIAWRQFSDIWRRTIDDIDYSGKKNSSECLKIVDDFLPGATGALYVRNYYDDSSRLQMMENVTKIVNNVKNKYIKMIEDATWINNITRMSAIKKVEAIKFKIGYPPEIMNKTILDEYNGDLKTNKSNYVETIINVMSWRNKHLLRKIKQSRSNDHWEYFATRVTENNAFYDQYRNEIGITAGSLRGIYYDNNHPQYMIYGTLGFTIGHELGHSLDFINRQNNAKGEMISWTEFDNAKYDYRMQCLNNQYKSFVDIKNKLRAEKSLTQNDDIADNVGLKAAYFAYKNLNIEENNQILHGKSYTPDQMFWISSASQWCASVDKLEIELPKWISNKATHSPKELRVLGPFSNMKQFSEDFMCPDDSPMNPYTKCVIW